MFRFLSGVFIALVFIPGPLVFAKRAAPKPVPPVSDEGVTYSAPNTVELMNYVVASDSSGKELFRVKVFEVAFDPKLEKDVQWVFITDLKIASDSLLVRDEKGRCFAVGRVTHSVRRKYGCVF